MNNSLAIILIAGGIFVIYLEQTGKLAGAVAALKSTGKGGEGFSTATTTKPIPGFRGRYYVTPLGVLNVTDAGTY